MDLSLEENCIEMRMMTSEVIRLLEVNRIEDLSVLSTVSWTVGRQKLHLRDTVGERETNNVVQVTIASVES